MLKYFFKILVILVIFHLNASFTIKRVNYEEARYKNVCKNLAGDALVYYIFVDTKQTKPWTTFDIKSTIDSFEVALKWMRTQAEHNNIQLNIKSDYHVGEEFTTIRKNLPLNTIHESLTKPSLKKGTAELNDWADGIAKRAGATLNIPENDGLPDIRNPKNKERLIAYLRDRYQVESVALVLLVNNYFRNDISVALNTFDTEDVEFAIVSYKYPSEIAHSILNLYGAADLYESPFRRDNSKIELAKEKFPNDIMRDPYAKHIQDLNIGMFTKYLVGWTEKLPSEYQPLIKDKIINF